MPITFSLSSGDDDPTSARQCSSRGVGQRAPPSGWARRQDYDTARRDPDRSWHHCQLVFFAVLDMGYLPVYGEIAEKCLIKKVAADGSLTQVATMTIEKGRATLDCASTTSPRRTSGPALQIGILKVELNMQLLHRRMGHSGIDAMRTLLMGKLVRGIEGGPAAM